ncbi:hypothetical protein F4775DRAFT_537768 [Biscogniauxia sp. FL1348]|nr:hypothetical protein F4775DRAFT_537768 [Biscogniauxia sp. FL1348]
MLSMFLLLLLLFICLDGVCPWPVEVDMGLCYFVFLLFSFYTTFNPSLRFLRGGL